jgi:hypothetical protein
MNDSQNLQENRYESFAGIKLNCDAKYYIDGQEYF